MDPLRTTESDIDQVFYRDLPWLIGFVIVIAVLFAIGYEKVPCLRVTGAYMRVSEDELIEESGSRSPTLFRISRIMYDTPRQSRQFKNISKV